MQKPGKKKVVLKMFASRQSRLCKAHERSEFLHLGMHFFFVILDQNSSNLIRKLLKFIQVKIIKPSTEVYL
jgi:prephenate dehydratase